MSYRTAEGAFHEGRDASGNEVFKVTIPLDEQGYFGRECPSCGQTFRINGDDYEALPDDVSLWCAYCGHQADHSDFITQQQKDRVMRVASDMGMQMISDMLDRSFGSMARSTRNSKFVKVTYRSKPFYPEPLPGIDEERLIRERHCPACGTRYAVFGDHRFCPVSGPLGAQAVAADALAAETAKLDALTSIPSDQYAVLREQGVFERLYVSTLASAVGIVEDLAGGLFRERVPDADTALKGKGNLFQRLDDLADLYSAHLAIDVRATPGLDWSRMKNLWAVRHVHTHNGGHVDERFLKADPTSRLVVGQRVVVTEEDARTAVLLATALCASLG